MSAPGGTPPAGRPEGVFPGSRLPIWRQRWGAVLLAAGVTLVLGLLLLLWPVASLVLVAVLIGIALLVTGVLSLLQGITATEENGLARVLYVLLGAVAALAGLYCLIHVNATIALLAYLVGAFWLFYGLVDIIGAARASSGSGRVATAIVGIASVIAGLIVVLWPHVSAAVLTWILGIWLICYAILLAFLAFQVRTVTRRPAHA